MNKGFFPCTEEKINVKGKEVPAVQCMTTSDIQIHAQNIHNLENAHEGLLGALENVNLMSMKQDEIKCHWYWPWCKKRFGLTEQKETK